jgi:hypothetical protein
MNVSAEENLASARSESPGAPLDTTPKALPYRWGYFQGVALIPFSLLLLLGVSEDANKPIHDPWYIVAISLCMGLIGFPLAYGLLLKKTLAIPLVYAMFGLSTLLVAVKVPIAIAHHNKTGDQGSAFFEAELLLVWLLSMRYYKRRESQFN